MAVSGAFGGTTRCGATVYANDKVVVEVRHEWCKAGCGICIEFCPRQSLALDNRGKAVVADLTSCNKCMRCEFLCPDFAITVR